jgi:hypothetical protein
MLPENPKGLNGSIKSMKTNRRHSSPLDANRELGGFGLRSTCPLGGGRLSHRWA